MNNWLTIMFLSSSLFISNQNTITVDGLTGKTIYDGATYSETELEYMLDSIGQIPISNEEIQRYTESSRNESFLHPRRTDIKLDNADFEKLKQTCNNGKISFQLAKTIFAANIELDSTYIEAVENTPILFKSFDKDRFTFDKFMISPQFAGSPGYYIYFFSKNKLISIHDNYTHFSDININSYVDDRGETIVYYNNLLLNGSRGLWLEDIYFYQYEGEELVPILDMTYSVSEICSLNKQLLYKANILKFDPLTVRIEYSWNMPYAEEYIGGQNDVEVIEDSAILEYYWDEKSKSLKPDFNKSTITNEQMLSFTLTTDNLFLLKVFYKPLKQALNGGDKQKRNAVLLYLNNLRNQGLD